MLGQFHGDVERGRDHFQCKGYCISIVKPRRGFFLPADFADNAAILQPSALSASSAKSAVKKTACSELIRGVLFVRRVRLDPAPMKPSFRFAFPATALV